MTAPVAVVTGASRGIGKALALYLGMAGYHVVCTARTYASEDARLPGSIEETVAGLHLAGCRASGQALDVRDEKAVEAFAQGVCERFGRCDLLINNAAIAPAKPALEDDVSRWKKAFDINVNGPFFTTYFLRGLLEAADGGGRIVNISSQASVLPDYGRASYTASKRGMEGMSQALAHDLRGRVAINVLRIDLPVFSEGLVATAGRAGRQFEDPVIVADAVLWMIGQELSLTGEIFTLSEMRKSGVVRPYVLAEMTD